MRDADRQRRRPRGVILIILIVFLLLGSLWVWQRMQFSRLRVPLIKAVEAGETERVRQLLDQGADPNVSRDYKPEPFTWSEILGVFFHSRLRTSEGRSVLMQAAAENRVEIVRALLEHGADVNLKTLRPDRLTIQSLLENDDQTALHFAAKEGVTECVRLLLSHGANINGRDSNGHTPLFDAVYGNGIFTPDGPVRKEEGCVALLLQQGADVNIGSNQGETPLMNAAGMGSYPTLCLLLEKGAPVNATDKNGWTPLMYAARDQQPRTAQKLLQSGSDVNARGNKGWTALHMAVVNTSYKGGQCTYEMGKENYFGMLRLLLDSGADTKLKIWNGKTAEQMAKERQNVEAVALLRKAAARLPAQNLKRTPIRP